MRSPGEPTVIHQEAQAIGHKESRGLLPSSRPHFLPAQAVCPTPLKIAMIWTRSSCGSVSCGKVCATIEIVGDDNKDKQDPNLCTKCEWKKMIKAVLVHQLPHKNNKSAAKITQVYIHSVFMSVNQPNPMWGLGHDANCLSEEGFNDSMKIS